MLKVRGARFLRMRNVMRDVVAYVNLLLVSEKVAEQQSEKGKDF
jgi:hypothetical protein